MFRGDKMKNLLIMRHAKSSWSNSFVSDHNRPLNKRGKKDAPRMGALLKQEEMVPELIISSTAERAMATAEAAALSADYENEIQYTRQFYHADAETYLEVLQDLPDDITRVMVVGHNPGMEELVHLLSNVDTRFTTANIAHIQLPIARWHELNENVSGELLNLWRPKELDS
jgi:phosphohistidine phosphatase